MIDLKAASIKDKAKKRLLSGRGADNALLYKLIIYAILIGIGFVYLYPIIFMVVNSFMAQEDLINPTIAWIPSALYFGNYSQALTVLDFAKTLLLSTGISFTSSVLQTVSCALAGYAFGRFDFRFKPFWLVVLIATFIIPSQVTIVPKYVMYFMYGIINTPFTVFLPAMLGQGLKSAIIVLVFFQFFRTYPKALDEAAALDGASSLRIFIRIALPISVPAIVVAMLFSFVWYWNETYQISLFAKEAARTLPVRLLSFATEFAARFPVREGSELNRINESIKMAATLITIAPLVVLYIILQKQFVEAIESNGITGE